MAGIESGISTILTYAGDNSHGYELRQRDYSIGTDCAGLGRLYAAAVEGVDVNSYPDCHSWDIADVLVARGCWQVMGFSEAAKQRGDVLVRVDPTGGTGHVVIYLGNNRICEAANNYDGKRGDSSGREILERSYYSYGYRYIVRPKKKEKPHVGIEKVEGGVYRLYNGNSGQHHFTSDHDEAETLANVGWTYEGCAWKVGSGDPVYRLYNPFGGAHMLTADAVEGMGMAVAGWVVESVAFKQGSSKDAYRLYNKNNGDHVFTTDSNERDSLIKSGWTDEGVAFKVN